jgi:hypothetical protein
VLRQEHRLFPQVVDWLAQDRVRMRENGTVVVQPDRHVAMADAALISPDFTG